MTELLHSPGFLGTNGNFAADMTLVLGIIVAILFTVGLALALMKKYEAHRWVQTTAASINLILVLWLMVLPFRDFVVKDMGGPRPNYFYVITTLHATLGTLALLLGVFIVLRANKLVPDFLRFKNYKIFMRTSYALYMITTLVGIWVYFTWFVNIPAPPAYH
jgi:uncharacterized membrane protein YozB (DUF420 family)